MPFIILDLSFKRVDYALLVEEPVLWFLKVNLKLVVTLSLLDKSPQGSDLLLLVMALIRELNNSLINPSSLCTTSWFFFAQLNFHNLEVMVPLYDLRHQLIEFDAMVFDFLLKWMVAVVLTSLTSLKGLDLCGKFFDAEVLGLNKVLEIFNALLLKLIE